MQISTPSLLTCIAMAGAGAAPGTSGARRMAGHQAAARGPRRRCSSAAARSHRSPPAYRDAARGPRRRSPLQALPRHGLRRCSWADTAASPKAGAHASSAAAAERGKGEQRAAAPRSGRSRGPPPLPAMEGAEEELALGVRRRSPVEEEQGRRRRSPLADGRGAGDRRGRASQRLAGGGGAGEESCVRGRSSRAGGRKLQGAGWPRAPGEGRRSRGPRGSGSRPPSLRRLVPCSPSCSCLAAAEESRRWRPDG